MRNHLVTILTVFLLSFILGQRVNAQKRGTNDTIRVSAWVTPEGDTIAWCYQLPVVVQTKMNPKWKKYWAEWTRLRNAVYVTYPYAKAAGQTIKAINLQLANVTNKDERKRIIHSKEKELRQQFGDKITQLSIYQGKVLMKLINRETGNNCYEIIQEYKGGFNAAFWQSVAFIFGSSLKQSYDASNQDKAIETIVKDVERMYGYHS